MRQLLEVGFFHADPHPGNLVATRDGSLAYFDFGMMGDIPRHYRVGLIRMVRTLCCVSNKHPKQMNFLSLVIFFFFCFPAQTLPCVPGTPCIICYSLHHFKRTLVEFVSVYLWLHFFLFCCLSLLSFNS